MPDFLASIKHWLADPRGGKIIALLIGIVLIQFFFHVLRRSLANYIQNSDARYP